MYIIEEAKIIPRIKARFYSIINDPFEGDSSHTKNLEFAFSLNTFKKGD